MSHLDFQIGIGGAAGQGIATPGNILARIFARRGLHLNTYNAHQSIIRGGHCFLAIRVSDNPVGTTNKHFNVLIALNQDTMDRHLGLMESGSIVLFDGDSIHPGMPANGVQLYPLPSKKLTGGNKLGGNTVALSAVLQLLGIEFKSLATILSEHFKKKGEAVVAENLAIAKAGYDFAAENFTPLSLKMPEVQQPLAILTGNQAIALGAAAAGVKFYAAYPMSPATGVLIWMAHHAQELGIMVRQVEDEIGVANMTIGAAHAGCRSMCATSGGGFALMTEAIGMAGMIETPIVCVDVQRAGPATGVPTKTEQGDLWQVLGAGQGDYPKFVVAPSSQLDLFNTIPELFNLCDKYQCPGLLLSDLLISESESSVDPNLLDLHPEIDRGETIFPGDVKGMENPYSGYNDKAYLRYENTKSGISPRAVPGVPGHIHVAATDEHDEDGTLISDEFTHPHKRKRMVDKRMRKMTTALSHIDPPKLIGPDYTTATLVGWGSTEGVITDAVRMLKRDEGVIVNRLHIKWIVPFHGHEIEKILSDQERVLIVENNASGQFARFLLSETGFKAHGHIRKYDGEPFLPHHIVEAVESHITGQTTHSVPTHEIMV